MITSRAARCLLAVSAFVGASAERFNEISLMEGHTVQNDHHSPLPHTYVDAAALPDNFDWGNKDGVSYLTKSLNQHIPHYCGSCWAHGALSALADRIKIARGAKGADINLSIQYILNCGAHMAGSCHGGSHSGTYQLIKNKGYVPYDTCQPYLACSAESNEGFCKHVDTTCTPMNTCRTCSTFKEYGGSCSEITPFPHATIKEYGVISNDVNKIMTEIMMRGPVATEVNADPILDYEGEEYIFSDHEASRGTNHIVSITGWGTDEETGKKYWHIRNSWGEYWGNLGYFKIEMGDNILGIEGAVAWAIPGTFTETNTACDEDGKNCSSKKKHRKKKHKKKHRHHQVEYVDPSTDVEAVQRRLGMK